MRLLIGLLIVSNILFSCNNSDKTPDVSGIKVQLVTQHFEKELFNLDTTAYSANLEKLIGKYPSFGENFISTVLGADPQWNSDSVALYVKGFTQAYQKVYDTASLVFKNFAPYEAEIKKGLQFVKHYFPAYKIPDKIITYIGPLNGYGDILADDALIVGLHLHLGNNFSLYHSELVQQTYPDYISRRFEPDYIMVNSMKNIVLDMYPEKLEEKTLVQQMVEKGKRLYLLSKFAPAADEEKLIGYTKEQLKEAYKHEKNIWDLFVQNNLLQTIDENMIKNYIGESPKTQELGDASPGNIGSFAGWQIVKKYMKKNPEVTLQKLMITDNETIFQGAKYKP
ncbi:MAG: hypothetical protein WCI49_05480 [Ferruginibacter sp.]